MIHNYNNKNTITDTSTNIVVIKINAVLRFYLLIYNNGFIYFIVGGALRDDSKVVCHFLWT